MNEIDVLSSLEVRNCENVYYVGTSKRGITIYKQQVRALNLIYSLEKVHGIEKRSKIAIIGGGITAITASAAALLVGFKVHLFESKPVLLHLQTGCKTRWVHPNIYDWPKVGSDFPYARLPILDWRDGYASDVAQHLLDQYRNLVKSYPNSYRECLGTKFEHIDLLKRSIRVLSSNPDYPVFYDEYDYVILATGFGLEVKRSKKGTIVVNRTNSYWRNDDLDQPYLDEAGSGKRKIVISGTGDGAMVDLLRSLLKNFHHGRLISLLMSQCKKPEVLIELIQGIKEKHQYGKPKIGKWLYHEFNNLPVSLLSEIKSYLELQHRQDTEVYLLGKNADFEEVLSLDKMSIFNAFIVYLLHSRGFFRYLGVKDTKISGNSLRLYTVRSSNPLTINFHTYVERHGPASSLRDSATALNVDKMEFNDNFDTSIRIWEVGWPNNKIFANRIEFVPPITQAIATTFVEILGSILMHLHNTKAPLFRLTFERFISINDELYFQQVCRYAGTSTTGSTNTIGRIFPSDFGIVGYAAIAGVPVLLQREEDFFEAVNAMNAYYFVKDTLNSMLCIPIFCEVEEEQFVNSALYLDSSEKDFFSEDVIDLIINSCKGFVKNLDKMSDNQEFNTVSKEFSGVRPASSTVVDLITNKSLKIGGQLTASSDRICFKNITTLDFYD